MWTCDLQKGMVARQILGSHAPTYASIPGPPSRFPGSCFTPTLPILFLGNNVILILIHFLKIIYILAIYLTSPSPPVLSSLGVQSRFVLWSFSHYGRGRLAHLQKWAYHYGHDIIKNRTNYFGKFEFTVHQ